MYVHTVGRSSEYWGIEGLDRQKRFFDINVVVHRDLVKNIFNERQIHATAFHFMNSKTEEQKFQRGSTKFIIEKTIEPRNKKLDMDYMEDLASLFVAGFKHPKYEDIARGKIEVKTEEGFTFVVAIEHYYKGELVSDFRVLSHSELGQVTRRIRIYLTFRPIWVV